MAASPLRALVGIDPAFDRNTKRFTLLPENPLVENDLLRRLSHSPPRLLPVASIGAHHLKLPKETLGQYFHLVTSHRIGEGDFNRVGYGLFFCLIAAQHLTAAMDAPLTSVADYQIL